MAAETQFTASTGLATISVANSNLDGSTGTYVLVISGASNGTKIKNLWIKAVGSTTAEGMVRFFINSGGNKRLFAEVNIPVVTQTGKDAGFERCVEVDLDLNASDSIYASTEIADTFNIIAEGLNWSYYSTSVRTDTTEYTANTGLGTVTTANTNLDGTGTGVVTLLTAGVSGSGWKGCRINSITIKATGDPTDGMVRLFIQDTGTTKKLWMEIPVNQITHSAKTRSYGHTIYFNDSFQLAPGYSILATTQLSQNFSITIDGEDWTYVA
ncbi:MAG: hypothetical protein ACXVPU_13530 [Bacteroidia bacterium]